MPIVVAGGIVRNRAWILKSHLRAISEAACAVYCRDECDKFHNYYVTGDNIDGTRFALMLTGCQHDLVCTGHPGYERAHGATRYDDENMAMLRNIWARNAIERWPNLTHLWVVDSDVLPAPDCLRLLLEVNKPIVGAWVPGCAPMEGWKQFTKSTNGWLHQVGNAQRTGKEQLHTEPFPATMLGGCYLIRRDAWDAGVRWAPHPQGEDGGFGDSARAHRVEMWAHPLAKCEHVMEQPA